MEQRVTLSLLLFLGMISVTLRDIVCHVDHYETERDKLRPF